MVTKDELIPYEGREQAYVKHELLQAYLERFMMILGQHCPRVLYVDCFAGPWGSCADDFSDTSFGRAAQILRSCQERLAKQFGKKREFRALFLESDEAAFRRLKEFADRSSGNGITFEAWNCEFQQRVENVASWIGGDFAFVLIDPKGYSGLIEPAVLSPLLRKRNVEALINYMWQFISLAVGHLGNQAHRDNLLALFGDEVLEAADLSSIDREGVLLRLYRQKLVAGSCLSGPNRTRTVSFPIEYPGRTHTKYFLIHATHNDLGVIKFAEASREAAATQNSVRFIVQQYRKEQRTGVVDLFGDGETELLAGERELTSPWLQLLPSVGDEIVVDEAVVARMIEENDCFASELQRGAVRLIQQGVMQNLDMKRHRPKNIIHYEGRGERLRRVS